MEDLVPETIEQVAVLAAVALVAVDQPAAAVEEVAAEDLEVRKTGQAVLANTNSKTRCKMLAVVKLWEVMFKYEVSWCLLCKVLASFLDLG